MGRTTYIAKENIFKMVNEPKGFDTLTSWQQRDICFHTAQVFNMYWNAVILRRHSHEEGQKCANDMCVEYLAVEHEKTLQPLCGARGKRSGEPCRKRAMYSKMRCKLHGGASTGARTLEGRIKSLAGLRQYKANPDALAARIKKLRTEWDDWPINYVPQGYTLGETVPEMQ